MLSLQSQSVTQLSLCPLSVRLTRGNRRLIELHIYFPFWTNSTRTQVTRGVTPRFPFLKRIVITEEGGVDCAPTKSTRCPTSPHTLRARNPRSCWVSTPCPNRHA